MACSMVILPPTSSRPYLSALLAEESDDDEDVDYQESKKQKLSEGDPTTDRTVTNFFLCKPTFPVDVNSSAFL